MKTSTALQKTAKKITLWKQPENTPDANALLRGSLIGLAAGITALALTQNRRSANDYNKTMATKAITIGLYVAGSLAATALVKLVENRKKKRNADWEYRLMTSAMM